MIKNNMHLRFYLKADMMMNRGYFKVPFRIWLQGFISPDYIMKFKFRKLIKYNVTT